MTQTGYPAQVCSLILRLLLLLLICHSNSNAPESAIKLHCAAIVGSQSVVNT